MNQELYNQSICGPVMGVGRKYILLSFAGPKVQFISHSPSIVSLYLRDFSNKYHYSSIIAGNIPIIPSPIHLISYLFLLLSFFIVSDIYPFPSIRPKGRDKFK